MEPTLVFAGVGSGAALELLAQVGVDAFMASYATIGHSPSFRRALEGHPRDQKRYLDSGVFTFMRRANVAYQTHYKKSKPPATWEEFEEYAKEYVAYVLSDAAKQWDHIIELDVDELSLFDKDGVDRGGVERADKFRKGLHHILGDRLLPVWHAEQRGRDGWSQMVRTFPYVCLSPTKKFDTRSRNRDTEELARTLIADAHSVGCRVHILGVEGTEWFDLGADTIDASSWASGARWGQYKLPGASKDLFVPGKEKKKRRGLSHNQIFQFEAVAAEMGFTLEDLNDERKSKELGIRLLLLRQEEARRARIIAQETG